MRNTDTDETNVMMKNSFATNISIEFKDLTYEVEIPIKKEKQLILKGITGRFKSSELTAIMGPSGAGKSSLMDILTGFTKHGVGGSIKFGNGNAKFRKLCCYITQEDNLNGILTMEECMMFAADLKICHKSMNTKQRKQLVENILNTLKLSDAQKTRCDRLSGGQRKRLSIALELINNPVIIFLDEPTTGLDSSASADIIQILQNLANEGRTVICTIHQPSSYIYEMFNQIYVLSKGYCVYQGSPQKTVQYLQSIDLECPPYHNPADFLLECVNGDYGDHIHNLRIAAGKTEWCCNSTNSRNSETLNVANEKIFTINEAKHIYPPPEWITMLILISRCHLQIFRDWTVTYVKLFVHIICAILFGLMYGNSGSNGNKQLANVGLLVIHCLYLWYTSTIPSVLRYPSEIPIIKKETFNNWYKLRTYYMASFITATPVNIITTLIYIIIVYLMTDQALEVDRFLKTVVTCAAMTVCAEGFGLLLGTIFGPINGVFVAAVLTAFLLIYSGFIVLLTHMSDFMRAISYITPMRYSLENFVLALYGNNRTDTICPTNVMYCHLKKPVVILKTLGMESGSYTMNLCLLILQLILVKVAGYFLLKHRLKSIK